MFSAYNVSTQYALIALRQLPDPICPICREPIGDEVEEIQFTATQQWDELLVVAGDWARIDNHGGDEPEDGDEEEVPFIDDLNGEPESGK